MKWLITFLLLTATGICNAALDDWSTQDQRLYKSFITLHTMDVIQTFALIECQERNPYCPYYETNRLVGSHPKKGEVIAIKLGMNYMIYNMLDKRLNQRERGFTLRALQVVSIYPVIQNEGIGLGIYIPIIPYRRF